MHDSDVTPSRPPDRERIARLVLDNAEDFAILTTGLEGRVTSWNTGAERLLGWSAEMLGQDACARDGAHGLDVLQKPYSLERLTAFVRESGIGGVGGE